MVIKWTNKVSRETGYVKGIRNKNGYFENTFDIKEARRYSAGTVGQKIEELYFLCDLNDYEAIAYERIKGDI